ncbi:MAG: hydroxyacid dehydrogenase [Treponema sp.]|nr:hydroxyacid dehydrogenase [Treponema sp.]
MAKVLIPQDIAEEGKAYLLERGYEIKMGRGTSVEQLKEDVRDCEAILARTAQIPREVILEGAKLKVIGRHGVGCENIDVEAATERGIWVTFTPEANAASVAEHTLGMIIALGRSFLQAHTLTREGNWEGRNSLSAMDLEGKTLGLIGAGRIGSRVAQKAHAGLGMKVLFFDPQVKEIPGLPEALYAEDPLTIFRESDFVSLHVPVTPETRGAFGKSHFEAMKKGAFFINAARGELVNEGDLFQALKEKRIAGAALDVFEKEPPGKDHPFFTLDNVILSPHSAALTKEALVRMALGAAMGIDEVLSGGRPRWGFNRIGE